MFTDLPFRVFEKLGILWGFKWANFGRRTAELGEVDGRQEFGLRVTAGLWLEILGWEDIERDLFWVLSDFRRYWGDKKLNTWINNIIFVDLNVLIVVYKRFSLLFTLNSLFSFHLFCFYLNGVINFGISKKKIDGNY